MKLLAMDPGTDKYGWAALVFKNSGVRILKCGMLDDTIKELKVSDTLKDDADAYTRRLAWLLAKSGAEHVAAERYVPRRQGLSNESVNMMLGTCVAYTATLGIECSLFLAATWKLRVKKFLDLERLYELAKPVPDHVVDALFIGLFAAESKGSFDFAKLTRTRQNQLCKELQKKYLDLRTGKRKYAAPPRKKRRARKS